MTPAKKTTKGASKKTSKTTGKATSQRRSSRRSKSSTAASTKKVADAAAKAARENGAKGQRLSAAKRHLRDSLIVARKAQGLSGDAIAAEAGVTTRTVERVLAERRGLRSPLEESPMKLLEDLTVGFKLSIGDYEALALAWFDTNQPAALGAKKAADETRARLGALLAEVGKLPSNLEVFRSEMEMQRIAEDMVKVMQGVASGEKDAPEAVEFFRGLLRAREQRQLAPAG